MSVLLAGARSRPRPPRSVAIRVLLTVGVERVLEMRAFCEGRGASTEQYAIQSSCCSCLCKTRKEHCSPSHCSYQRNAAVVQEDSLVDWLLRRHGFAREVCTGMILGLHFILPIAEYYPSKRLGLYVRYFPSCSGIRCRSTVPQSRLETFKSTYRTPSDVTFHCYRGFSLRTNEYSLQVHEKGNSTASP